MSASFEFTADGLGVIVTCRDNLISEDLLSANREIYATDKVANNSVTSNNQINNKVTTNQAKGLRYYIVDLSEVDSLEIAPDKLLLLARRDKTALEANPELKIAFVTNHEVVQSVVSMWCGYIDYELESVQQFSTLEDACDWTGHGLRQRA